MKRLVVLGLILGSLGLAACAVGVDGQGQGEKVDQQTNELDDQGTPSSPGDDGNGTTQPSTGVDLKPENLTYGGEPEGPTPHPWQTDDPNDGPTPHPWGTGTSGGSGTGTNDPAGDDNTQGTSTHVNVY